MNEVAEMTADEIETELSEIGAIVEYSDTQAGLNELRSRLKDVAYDLTTVKGNAEARADRKELVTLRTSLEKRRKDLNADDQRRIALRNEKAKELTAAILELETPIDDQIKRDEERREAERRAKAEAAAAEAREIAETLDRIRAFPVKASHKGSVVIAALIEDLALLEVPRVATAEAEPLILTSMEQLKQMRADALAGEETARKLREERAELDRQRKADEERRRVEDEARAAAQKIEDARIAEERRKAKAEADAQIAAERAEMARQAKEAQALLDARQREIDAVQAEQRRLAEEAAQKAEEARRVEAKRVAAEQAKEEQERVARLAAEEAEREKRARLALEAEQRQGVMRAEALELVRSIADDSSYPTKSRWNDIAKTAQLILNKEPNCP